MAGGEQGTSEAALHAIPVVVAAELQADPAPPRAWYQIGVPRIVDYLIVAVFMFFWL